MARKAGNPGWTSGHGASPAPEGPCAFERQIARLGLQPEQYKTSAKLREWCVKNRRSHFIPEELLRAWGIVDVMSLAQDALETSTE